MSGRWSAEASHQSGVGSVNNKCCLFIERFQRSPSIGMSLVSSFRYNTYSYLGSDAPDVVMSGRSQDNVFRDNTIIGGKESLKIMTADGTQFIDNTFLDALTIRFDNATKTTMSGNTGLTDVKLKVANGASFDEKSDYGFEPIG